MPMENPVSVPLDNRSRNQPSEARSKSENKSMKMGWRCKNAGAMVSSASLQHKHFCERGRFMTTVAIIGGGPGGLLAAYFWAQKCPLDCDITVFEASGRLGGKVLSRRFTQASVPYEAGVAGVDGFFGLGADPARELLTKLG